MDSPFHRGEQAVQERLGLRDVEIWARRAIRDHLPEAHREFFATLPFVVAAARDDDERPWVTLLAGGEGFVTSPSPSRLHLAARPPAGDALEGALRAGADVGLLGIEPATRRRNRANGRITGTEGGIEIVVDQSFGNCAKHIRRRWWRHAPSHRPGEARRGEVLTSTARRLVEEADTFFIGSGHRPRGGEHAAFGMDASHRGGAPGFVEVEGPAELVFPDYWGNNLFNTLGNLELDPRVGLTFVDFASGGLLQLSGRAGVEALAARDSHADVGHRVRVAIERVVELPGALPLRWDDAPPPG
ncbi:MAG: pyridoxamine 5'-phosphate oxidase family protein [Myxococcales bacterium]|nr:pyridoxamine 5'-phosphate oxidase family protein [Myxococcales bacterium]